MKKIFLILIIGIFFNHCNFTPLHKNLSGINFNITNISFEGEQIINRYIKINLDRYKNEKAKKNFNINIKTVYEKTVLSKDKTAKISNYQLIANSTFEIFLNGELKKKITINEKENMENIDDNFEEKKKERIIKQNFASIISNKIIAELSLINAN